MTFTPEQRAELRELEIAAHPKLAAVLTGLDEGLTWEQIAERGDFRDAQHAKGWYESYELAASGQIPTGKTRALYSARVLGFVLDLHMTPGLRSALNAQLLRLRAINPEIPPEPGGRPGTFGNYEKRAPERKEGVCPTCHLTRPCECDE